MLHCQIRLPGPKPEETADVPAARVAWIQGERAIDQKHHRVDVLAESGERHGSVCQNPGIVASYFHGAAPKLNSLLPDILSIRSGGVCGQKMAAVPREAESWGVLRVTTNR